MAKTFKNHHLMNHSPKCLDIWHGTYLWQGVSSSFK